MNLSKHCITNTMHKWVLSISRIIFVLLCIESWSYTVQKLWLIMFHPHSLCTHAAIIVLSSRPSNICLMTSRREWTNQRRHYTNVRLLNTVWTVPKNKNTRWSTLVSYLFALWPRNRKDTDKCTIKPMYNALLYHKQQPSWMTSTYQMNKLVQHCLWIPVSGHSSLKHSDVLIIHDCGSMQA